MRNADRAAEGIMALEFLLLAFVEGNQPLTLNRFNDPLKCEAAIDELSEFNRLHSQDHERWIWELEQRVMVDTDPDYEPKPFPADKKYDPVAEVERLIAKKRGQEVVVNETLDVWENIPILTDLITYIKYGCIASPK